MKASNLLKRYAAGERNFQHANLKGQSFKNRDLSGADFSDSDIQGTNFTGANLRGANFTRTKAGLPKQGIMIQRLIGLSVSIASGVILAITSWWTARLFADNTFMVVPCDSEVYISRFLVLPQFAVLAVIITMLVAIIRQGFTLEALRTFTIAVAFAVVCAVFVGMVIAGIVSIDSDWVIGINTGGAIAIGIGVAAIIGFVGILSGAGAVVGFAASSVANSATAGIVVISVIGAIGLLGAGGPGSVTAAVSITVAVILLSIYMTRRALAKDEKYDFIRTVAIALMAYRGTSFHNADLTDADFTRATLESTDFRDAHLTFTRWNNVKKFDLARTGTSYLQNPNIRQLLVTNEGQNQNFDHLNLRGINLQDANLQDASFIGTDLNRANLQNADLSRAKLVQTLLEGADLTRATLTGACIEDWGISNTTKLIQIDCDEIFLKLSTKEPLYRQRRPADQERNFEPGEFAKLAQKIPNTVDLVFKDGIDWQTFLQTFQELRVESDTGELPVIQTIENKGDGAFVIRVKVPEEIDEAEYERKFWLKYQPMLEAKDEQIVFYRKEIEKIRKVNTKLIGVVETMAEKENAQYNFHAPVGSVGNQGTQTNVAGLNQGTQIETQYNSPQEKTLAEAAEEIQNLLSQLEQTNPTATVEQQQAYVDAAIPPTLKERCVSALRAAGETAIDEFFNNPYVKVGKAIVMAWIQS